MKSESSWFRSALMIVAAVTITRLVALAFDRTDLFVDEAQYWLWGQHLDFGYFSKPPLIGWLLGGVSEIAGSSVFWVRMPGMFLHGATALVLGALSARISGRSVGIWTATLYVTVPFAALGSVLMSTDTVMAPFFAAAILFFWRAGDGRLARDAAIAGICAGLAFLAKYAAIYFVIGAVLAAVLVPARRIGARNTVIMAVAFFAVIAPNLWWNVAHQFQTVHHTINDNIGAQFADLRFGNLVRFWCEQLGVFGPFMLIALVIGWFRRGPDTRALMALSIPALLAVSVEAIMHRAYANWAISAYFAGTVLAVMVLPVWARYAQVALNLCIAVAIPAVTVLAPWPMVNDKPAANRYLGRGEMSQRIIALSIANNVPLFSADRDVLADLFFTGRDRGVTIYAPRPTGRPANYYEATFPLPDGYDGPILVIRRDPISCDGIPMPPAGLLNGTGAWADEGLMPYMVDGACLAAAD